MVESSPTGRPTQAANFEEEASRPQTGLIGEFLHFLAHNRKWWLVPILLVLLALGILVVLGGTGAAPLIYTIF